MAGCGLAVLLLASGCAAPATTGITDRGIQQTLDRRAAAVLGHDESGYLSATDPGATGLRVAQRKEFENLAAVPLRSWTYRLGQVRRRGAVATAEVELRYRIAGYDSVPVIAARRMELAEHGRRWYLTADGPGRGAGQQLWQQGKVQVVKGEHSLVLGVHRPTPLLRQVASVADRAVPEVQSVWHGPWAGRVVVLVPSSVNSMAALLGSPPASYRGIAAVTTGEAGGSDTAPADRVIINPAAYAILGDLGKRVVITHETTHVATRAQTSPGTPLWLSEGFADWLGYRGTGTGVPEAAPELQQAVHSGDLPGTLPTDADFGFGGNADTLARAYEGGWLACRMIAEKWGERKLTDFYRAVGTHGRRDGAVEAAMNDVLATTPEDFTAQWRAYLRAQLG
ncbi:hypothetical protein AB0436_01585 [Streptomyces sp. NPDC051322]|uniref:hypothetical protein n=1 Tax=Streptomyces sp. NPDC051322 TaxID=3154645 RepID=UPI00344FA096